MSEPIKLDLEEQAQLPFSERKQDAVLGHLLMNERFFMQARHRIQPGWFNNPINGKVWKAKIDFYTKNKRFFYSTDEFKQQGDFVTEEAAIANKMRAKTDSSTQATQDFGLDVIQEELEGWLRARMFKETAYNAQKLYNAHRHAELWPYLKIQAKEIWEARFSADEQYDFSNWRQAAQDIEKDKQRACTFGLVQMDRLLLPDAPRGSLLPGDTTVLLAPTNTGKTTALITMIAHNILMGKKVLFFTHEGRPADISQKVWCSLMNVSQARFFELMKTPEGLQRIDNALKWINKFLVYVPYNKAGATIEDVEPMIRRRQEEMMSKNGGKGFDLLVCDYPAKLTSQLARGGNMAKRNIDEIVYDYYVQLALEYSFHSLLAIQTNREGSRVNKGQKDDGRLLTVEDVLESWGPMTTATNVISINRDPLSIEKKLVTFYVCKSRSNETGFAVVCRSNYHHARTHSDELGCVWYRGGFSMTEKVESLLEQYKNQPLPEHIR